MEEHRRSSEIISRNRRKLISGLAVVGGLVASGLSATADAATGTYDLNVQNFGAVGNGTGDDTAAIQSAFDAAAAAPFGATVYIPPGIYNITNVLLIGPRSRIMGAGTGITVLRGKAGSYPGKSVNGNGIYSTLAMVAVSQSSVEHLTVDHATNGTWANGIIMVPDGVNASGTVCTNCVVEHCQVLGFDAHEYLIWSQRGQYIKILNNYVYGNVTGYDSASSQEGIECFGGYDVLIQGNTVLAVGNNGINIGAAVGVPNAECFGVRIVDNYVNVAGDGINLGTSWDSTNGAQNLTHIHVEGNVVISAWRVGILLQTTIAGTTLTDIRISENSIAESPVGVQLYGIASDTTHYGIVVNGNTIVDATSVGEAGLAAFFMKNTMIINNTIRNSSNSGMYLYGLVNATVSDNSIDTAQRNAIYSDSCSDLYIVNNRFRNYNGLTGQPGLVIAALSRGVIQGNSFDVTTESYAINVDSASNEVRVTGNSLMYAATYNPPFVNSATNANAGVASLAAGSSSVDVMNTLATGYCRFIVTQDAGEPLTCSVQRINGGFRLLTSSSGAVGNETFRWEIIQ
ncbi:MAG: right-handed parallel beta-helix repeat-containing protein [Acidiferrobacterales bacterium]